MYCKAYDNVTKAIELNAEILEVGWLRVKSSLIANAPVEYYKISCCGFKCYKI